VRYRTAGLARRRRRLLIAVALVVVIAAAAVVGAWAITGRGVVPGLSKTMYPIHYREGIARAAERYGLDPYLVAAVVQTESGYDPQAVSHAGAVGLMQLMPDTAKWIVGLASWRGGDHPDLNDPDDNLELGACYLSFLMRTFAGGTRAALAAYNAGQGVVEGWVKAAGGPDSFGLADIHFPETRDFVVRVERYWDLYSRIYPEEFSRSDAAA
jgi:soluble lytic murein transglycosylase